MISRPAFFARHGPARVALSLMLLAGPGLSPAQAILANEVIDPRTFGYVVGDKIRREVHLTVQPGYRLDEESLPDAGRLDRWLEVAEPEIRSESDRQGRHYRLVLTYQLRNAPAAPDTVAIPQQNLRLVGEAQAVTTLVPSLRVTVAPLTSAIGADRISGSVLQRDRPPAPLPVEGRQRRLAWTGAALLALLLVAAWRRGFMALARGNLPFAKAVRELKRLQHAPDAPARYAESLKIVHDAINRTAGRAVFAHNLDDFLASHPEFASLREEFDRLFAASGRVFFAPTAAGAPAAGASRALLRLCQLCRGIERRAFAVRSPGKLHAARN